MKIKDFDFKELEKWILPYSYLAKLNAPLKKNIS